MALRDQPYLPLYIQDIMTDEKLNECSAATHGIYIKGIMCLMHKSEQYGKLLLKQNYKQIAKQTLEQTSEQRDIFCYGLSLQLQKHLPYTAGEILAALAELLREKVCSIEDDYLVQKRMVKDNAISEARKNAGNTGVKKKREKANKFAKAKQQANPEYENEYDNETKPVLKPVLINPFFAGDFSAEFSTAWKSWKAYKKAEHKFQYKALQTEQAALISLAAKAAGSEETAIAIINQSIANGWKGFVELQNSKNHGNPKTNQSVVTGNNRNAGINDAFASLEHAARSLRNGAEDFTGQI